MFNIVFVSTCRTPVIFQLKWTNGFVKWLGQLTNVSDEVDIPCIIKYQQVKKHLDVVTYHYHIILLYTKWMKISKEKKLL